MTDQKHTKELFEAKLIEIDSLVKKITKLSLDSAQHVTEGCSECPLCGGEGDLEVKYYENIDEKAFTVGFFGIGDEHVTASSLWELLNKETLEQLVAYAKIGIESPLDLRTQLDELTKQRDELREALEEMVQMAEFSTGIGFDQIGPEHDGPYPKAVRLLTKTKGAA